MGYTMNILTTILPAFLVIVCVGDSVHLQSVYRDERIQGIDNREAIVRAVGMTAMPMLFTHVDHRHWLVGVPHGNAGPGA